MVSDSNELRAQIAELRQQRRSSEEREAALHDVIRTIAESSFNLDHVFQTIVDRATALCQAEGGEFARREGDVYRVVALIGAPPEYERLTRERSYAPGRDSLIGRIALERRVIQIVDVLDDPEYSMEDLQKAGDYRTILGVPMLRQGDPIGVIALGRYELRAFSDEEIRLVESFAAQAVMAIEHVRLFETVERQRTELARFAPQVADLLSSDEGEQLLAGHRKEISALFCDLRGFTAFAETAEPEEVLGVLREYHAVVGDLVVGHGGTVEHFAGDGLMAFFNDPTPITDHELEALRTAVAIRESFSVLATDWRKKGYNLGLGMGIATGYATLGRIGFEGRYDYGAIGNVVILASRLSDAASENEILISQRTYAATETHYVTEPIPELQLKGFSRPVTAVRVVGEGRD